jgi:two-component system, sensor histidine kinase and response regulator
LKIWRQSSDSIYFDVLHRAMAMPPDVIVPRWVAWTVTALAIFILMLLSLNILLRWKVNQRTHSLHLITQELTDQRAHLEELINERNAELQALFNSASVGIVHLKNRIIVRCNHRINELFGYDADELVGKPTKIWYANQEDWSLMGNNGYESIWQNKDFIHEQMMVRKDGSFFWVKLSGRAIDIADSSKGVVIVIEDMTSEHNAIEEMRKAKNVAEEATRMKSEFLANMSHEIRTPMNAILGMLYLALKSDLTPNLHNYLSKAQIAARSLLSIINDILDFSKIEAGKMQIENTKFSLDTVLEQVTDTIAYQAEQKGIEFLIRYDVTMPSMLIGDPLRLGQILLNLCGNAVKFTEKGEVELAFHCESVTETDLVLHVCVHDSGIGMSLEHQSKLFMKFTQADQSITRHYGGTGLGLAICKNLALLMNGNIWIEKSEPGCGTKICFSIPFKIANEAQIHHRKLLEQAGPQLEGLRALIVDDNALSREILTEMLHLFRVDVSTAENGYSALKILERATDKPFDVILMDWKMPGMTGDEVTQRIHSNRFIQHHPKIILITSYGREDVIRIAEQVGVDGFIIKPISPSTLLDTVLSVLGRATSQTILENDTADICLQSNDISYHGVRILLVEDNEINREFAKTLLESHGIEVDEVWNGEEALLQVQNQHYDAVLMDIQMPIMDGL